MSLKIAFGQFTDQFGSVQNALLTWYGANINYGIGGSVQFAAYEDQAESERNNRKALFTMPIDAADILAMFSRSGIVALEISEASWDLAQTIKFIPSRIFDKDGNPKMEMHNLADLNFQIIEIQMPDVLVSAINEQGKK